MLYQEHQVAITIAGEAPDWFGMQRIKTGLHSIYIYTFNIYTEHVTRKFKSYENYDKSESFKNTGNPILELRNADDTVLHSNSPLGLE